MAESERDSQHRLSATEAESLAAVPERGRCLSEMPMAELKTKKTNASVEAFLNQIKDEETRQDCVTITKLMKQLSRSDPKMWGSSIIGFGSRRLKYASGRKLDWMLIGFSPRRGAAVRSLYSVCSMRARDEA